MERWQMEKFRANLKRLRLNFALAGNQEHQPAKHNRRAHKADKAVDAVAQHLPGRIALGDAKDRRGKQGKEKNRGKVRGMH
jgi:hypothetical protein